MRLARKYGSLVAVFFSFMLPLGGIVVVHLVRDIQSANRILETTEDFKAMSAQVLLLQTERGLTYLWLEGGGTRDRGRLVAQRRETDDQCQALLDRLSARANEGSDTQALLRAQPARDEQLAYVRSLADRRAVPVDEIFDRYVSLIQGDINRLRVFANAVHYEQSLANLLDIPNALEQAKEYVGIERAHVAAWLKRGRKPDAGERRHWRMIVTRAENALEQAQLALAATGGHAGDRWLAAEGEQKRLTRLRADAMAGLPVGPGAWFEQASRYMDKLQQLNFAVRDEIAEEAARRARWLRLFAVVLVALLAAAVAVSVYFVNFTRRRVIEPVHALHNAAVALEADPDGAYRVAQDGHGELGALIRTFNNMVSSSQAARRKLTASEQRYATLVEQSLIGIYQVENGRFTYANPRFLDMFGYELGALKQLPPLVLVAPQDRERIAEQMRLHLDTPYADAHYVFTGLCARGQPLAVEAYGTTVVQDGRTVLIGMCHDVSERRRAEHEMSLAATVFDASRHGILVTDAERRILRVNPAFESITGYTADEAVGRAPKELLHSGRQDGEFYGAMWRAINADGLWEGEIWSRRKNGEIYPEWLSIDAVRDADGNVTHYVGVFTDLSQQKAMDARVRDLSLYDPLTNLPNRSLIHERLEQALARARGDGTAVAVLFLDLDHFKNINDSLGHMAGDGILRQVAERLRGVLRSGGDGREPDTIGRMGGDEFVAILPGLSDPGDAPEVAASILRRFTEPFGLHGQSFRLTVSIGVSVCPHDGDSVEALMRHADLAMYEAKRVGRNNFRLYTAELEKRMQSYVWIESHTPQALARGEFALHYQPQVHVESGRIVGVEALMRWQSPERGSVSPGEFIPVLEEVGLIEQVGAWTIERACADLAAWRTRGLVDDRFRVSVNLSGRQLHEPALPARVAEALTRHGLPPDVLELELTETVAMEHLESSDETLRRLSGTGVRLAIDDFGTGHSSLARLHRFGFHRLKIDQRFVRGLESDAAAQSIVRATVALAHSLGLEALAEGVETPQQLDVLRRLGCDTFQGFLASPALPSDGVEPMLAKPFVLPPPAGNGVPATVA